MRRESIARRDALSAEDIQSKSSRILESLIGMDEYRDSENVLVYASMRSEVPTDDIILDALAMGKKVFCPRVTDPDDAQMMFREIESPEDLKEGYYGIREPEIPEGYEEPEFDPKTTILIVPGVAFDRERNRIGYCGGFYDRFLRLHPELKSVALSFECQIMDEPIPVEAHDKKPDVLITEDCIY